MSESVVLESSAEGSPDLGLAEDSWTTDFWLGLLVFFGIVIYNYEHIDLNMSIKGLRYGYRWLVTQWTNEWKMFKSTKRNSYWQVILFIFYFSIALQTKYTHFTMTYIQIYIYNHDNHLTTAFNITPFSHCILYSFTMPYTYIIIQHIHLNHTVFTLHYIIVHT